MGSASISLQNLLRRTKPEVLVQVPLTAKPVRLDKFLAIASGGLKLLKFLPPGGSVNRLGGPKAGILAVWEQVGWNRLLG